MALVSQHVSTTVLSLQVDTTGLPAFPVGLLLSRCVTKFQIHLTVSPPVSAFLSRALFPRCPLTPRLLVSHQCERRGLPDQEELTHHDEAPPSARSYTGYSYSAIVISKNGPCRKSAWLPHREQMLHFLSPYLDQRRFVICWEWDEVDES